MNRRNYEVRKNKLRVTNYKSKAKATQKLKKAKNHVNKKSTKINELA